ncbi:MarR family transcriptional regulator [Sulfitobacter sp. LCG007]
MRSIALRLQETSSLMKREFERVAKPHGLTLTQWRVIGELSRTGAMRQVELGSAINASAMTVSDVADRLEAAGLVVRGVDPLDGRAKTVELSPQGREKLVRMREISAGVFDKALAGIAPSDIEAMTRALARIVENLEDR